MKVIDLLNKIANGEEVPKKITIDEGSYEFEWNGNMYIHRFRNKYGDYCDFVKPDYIHNLDKEIHIIEDIPKEDRCINVCGSLFTKSECDELAKSKEDKKIKKLEDYTAYDDGNIWEVWNEKEKILVGKINEIIDKVNGDK